jgi:hypothetical protein
MRRAVRKRSQQGGPAAKAGWPARRAGRTWQSAGRRISRVVMCLSGRRAYSRTVTNFSRCVYALPALRVTIKVCAVVDSVPSRAVPNVPGWAPQFPNRNSCDITRKVDASIERRDVRSVPVRAYGAAPCGATTSGALAHARCVCRTSSTVKTRTGRVQKPCRSFCEVTADWA